MSELLITVLLFLVYLLAQAFFINGIYISSKGSEGNLPDGTLEKSEMILYPFYRFLNQHSVKRVGFKFPELSKRVNEKFPLIEGGLIRWDDSQPTGWYSIIETGLVPLDLKALYHWAQTVLDAKIFYEATNKRFFIYQEVNVYKYSKYLRKPIITCVICMASFWSIFTFFIPGIIIFGLSFKILIIWIANVFCLSYLNFLIFKPRR